MVLTGRNLSIRSKACSSVTLSDTNPTRTDLGSKAGLRAESQAANRQNGGKTLYVQREGGLAFACDL